MYALGLIYKQTLRTYSYSNFNKANKEFKKFSKFIKKSYNIISSTTIIDRNSSNSVLNIKTIFYVGDDLREYTIFLSKNINSFEFDRISK